MSKKKARKKTAAEKRSYAQKSLANNVEKSMKRYLNDLNGHSPNQLYDFFHGKKLEYLSDYLNLDLDLKTLQKQLILPSPPPKSHIKAYLIKLRIF